MYASRPVPIGNIHIKPVAKRRTSHRQCLTLCRLRFCVARYESELEFGLVGGT